MLRTTGYAFVVLASQEDCESALKRLNQTELQGRTVFMRVR